MIKFRKIKTTHILTQQLRVHTQFISKRRYTVATKLEDLEDKMKATS